MKLCISNLTSETTGKALADLFAPFGPVASADVWVMEGAAKASANRIGYMVMSNGGAAAASALDGAMYRGRHLVVGEMCPWDTKGPGRV